MIARRFFQNVFSEWLPALKEYEFAAGYCVEMYDDPAKYPNGTQGAGQKRQRGIKPSYCFKKSKTSLQ